MKEKLRYINSLVVVLSLLLCVGCNQDQSFDSDKNNQRNSGEIQFFVAGIEEISENDMTTRSLTESEPPMVFVKNLNNGYTLTATLEREQEFGVHSRATSSLPSGIKYCIVAYKDGGDKETDSRQGTYTVGSISKLTLPPGTYQLYAYSHNSTATIEQLAGDDLRNIKMPYKEDISKEFLFYKMPQKVIVADDGTVTNGNISITFSRKTSRLTVKLNGEASQSTINSGGRISINPYRYGSFDPTLIGGMGNWNSATIGNESGDWKLNNFISTSSYTATSTCYIIPKAGDNRTIKLNNISIGSEAPKDNINLSLSYSFVAGYQYTMKIKVTPSDFSEDIEIDGVKWARSNSRTIGATSNGTKFHDYSYQFIDYSASYWGYLTQGPNSGETYRPELSKPVNWNEHKPFNSGDSFACPDGYRLPTKSEFENLLSKPHCWGTYGTYVYKDGNKNEVRPVQGMFFNTPTQPNPGEESNYLFLPFTGRYLLHVYATWDRQDIENGYYWTCNGTYVRETKLSPDNEDVKPLGGAAISTWEAYCAVLSRQGANVELKYCAETKKCAIRCVKE